MTAIWLITCDNVRDVCIKNNFYNAGSNDDYENMFSNIKEKGFRPFNLEEVFEIAQDIANHTSGLDDPTDYVLECLLNEAHTLVKW